MTKRAKISIGVLAGISVLVVAVLLTFQAMVRGMCGEILVARSSSPEAWVTARAVERDCGATTSRFTHVEFSWRSSPNEWEPVFSSKWIDNVQLTWLNENHLQISYQKSSVTDIRWQVTKWGSRVISYKALPEGEPARP